MANVSVAAGVAIGTVPCANVGVVAEAKRTAISRSFNFMVETAAGSDYSQGVRSQMFSETEVTMAHDFSKEQVMHTTHESMEHIYREWDDALSKLDVDRLLELY